MKTSAFRFYSKGQVAVNKLTDSDVIEVLPIEVTPMVDGELTDNYLEFNSSSVNSSGEHIDSSIKATNTIKATWLSIGNGNRVTSPDVRRGEIVIIYQFGDSDNFFWDTQGNFKELRRLETVINRYSNLNEEGKAADANSSYWTEVSTHRSLIHLHTSRSNGEPFEYDMQINAKEGEVILIKDDVGNYIYFSSRDTRIVINNKDNSFIDVNKVTITAEADYINLNARKKLTINTPEYEANTTTNTINSTNTTVNASTFTVNANVGINGGSLTHNGTNVGDSHIHGKVASGFSKTDTPE